MNAIPSSPSSTRLERLGQYLAVDPDNVTLLQDYAREAWAARESQACVQALRKVQQLGALDLDHQALMGRALVACNDTHTATAELQKALQRWPESALLRFELARALLVLGDVEQALEQLPEPDEPGELGAAICALRVRLLHHSGQLEQAVEVVQRFEAEAGRHPGVEAALLPVLSDLGLATDAVERAERLAAAGGDATPYEVCEPLAMAALDAQRTAESRHWLDRAMHIRSDDGRIWLISALTHLQAGDNTSASSAATHAAELMPHHAGSHLAKGWIALLMNDRTAARRAFEDGIHASDAFAEGYGSLAVVEALEGRPAQADELVRKALLLDKHCASAQYARLLRRGDAGERLQDLARAVLSRARSPRQRMQ
jgi:tetratricopeptide (TPR) repeat protein